MCSGHPAAWLRPESASYSPRMPITGLPEPYLPQNAVLIPASSSVTSKPYLRSVSQYSFALANSFRLSSGLAQTASETPVKIPAFSSIYFIAFF